MRWNSKYQAMTDVELRDQTPKFPQAFGGRRDARRICWLRAFAVCREAGRRVLAMAITTFQMMGGNRTAPRLHRGNGHRRRKKPLVATLPAYLKRVGGQGRFTWSR